MDSIITINNLLLVRDPWASLILSGKKSWEVRSTNVAKDKFKTIAIAKSGEKGISRIYGLVDIVESKGPLRLNDLQQNFDKHQDIADTRSLPYKKTYAWVLKNPRILKTPIDYEYKNGWVIWGVGEWQFQDSDFIERKYVKNLNGPLSHLKQNFIDSLIEDFGFFDVQLSHHALEHADTYTVNLPQNVADGLQRDKYNKSFKKLQNKNRSSNSDKLDKIAKLLKERKYITNSPVEIEKLNLIIHPVTTNEEKDIHWYFRMHQNIPSSKSKGRVMDLLIFHVDINSGQKHIVGIVGLGSAAYTSGGRDDLFGWPKNNYVDRDIKDKGLKSILQINCILAVAPYDKELYRLTKLLAMTVFTKEIVSEYYNKYESPMLCAISSAGFGLYAPLFNRISLGSLAKYSEDANIDRDSRCQNAAHGLWNEPSYAKGERKNSRHWVFHKEASSKSILYGISSEETYKASKLFCESATSVKKMTKSQSLKSALQMIGIDSEIFPKVERGIYIGFLCNSYITQLVQGNIQCSEPKSFTWSSLFGWWQTMEVKRLGEKA